MKTYSLFADKSILLTLTEWMLSEDTILTTAEDTYGDPSSRRCDLWNEQTDTPLHVWVSTHELLPAKFIISEIVSSKFRFEPVQRIMVTVFDATDKS